MAWSRYRRRYYRRRPRYYRRRRSYGKRRGYKRYFKYSGTYANEYKSKKYDYTIDLSSRIDYKNDYPYLFMAINPLMHLFTVSEDYKTWYKENNVFVTP